jgi:hypothetical protein
MSNPLFNTFQNQLLIFTGSTGGSIVGPQGVEGFQGVQGFLGNLGNQGPQGSIGPLGNQGHQGWQGFQGEFGIQGGEGFQGRQGDAGLQGNDAFGLQGTQGTQGWQGVSSGGFNFTRGTTSVSFSGSSPFTATITHGLGTTPTSVLVLDGSANHSGPGNILILGLYAKSSTTFSLVASDFDTSIFIGSRTISWMAIA